MASFFRLSTFRRLVGAPSKSRSLRGSYGVVLIYRGAWCPYCQAMLGGFQRASEKSAEASIKVVALSVDDEATTVGTIEKYKLRFPVGHSADAHQVSALTGAYTNEEPRYLQSTGFLLDPDGRVLNAVYSSGPDRQVGCRRCHRNGHLSQIKGLIAGERRTGVRAAPPSLPTCVCPLWVISRRLRCKKACPLYTQ